MNQQSQHIAAIAHAIETGDIDFDSQVNEGLEFTSQYRRRVMRKNPPTKFTQAGYYLVGPTGGPIDGPYRTPSEAGQMIYAKRASGIQFLSGDPGTEDWQISKPKAFPYGSNTVTGRIAAEIDVDGHCPACDASGEDLLVNSETDEEGCYEVECAKCGWTGIGSENQLGYTDLVYYDEDGEPLDKEGAAKWEEQPWRWPL